MSSYSLTSSAVFGQRMQLHRLARRGSRRQRLGHRHLVDQDLPVAQRRFGMRCRVWMMLASRGAVVVRTPVVRAKKRRMFTALVVSSAPGR
jgi:hypothetical protein